MNTIIKTQNLSFEGFLHYDDIHIYRHQATFIMGASGSGKSTLFKLINRTADKSDGLIFYDQKVTDTLDPIDLRKQIVLLGQESFIFDSNIRQNFYNYYQFLNKEMITDKKIKEYLDIACLNFKAEKPCENLSGGEKQRLFIAIHLSLIPTVFLLDEPTSALDQTIANEVLSNTISFCNQNQITPVIISHSEKMVLKYAKQTIRIDKR